MTDRPPGGAKHREEGKEMQEIAIKRNLNEETRKQAIWLQTSEGIKVFSLHITEHDEVIITDNSDYTKIYSVQSLGFYNLLERQEA